MSAAAQLTGTTPAQIYSAGSGARDTGMGSALTAVSNDVSALYYNPSGLASMTSRQATMMQASLYGGAAYNYLGYAQPLGRHLAGIGVELMRLGIGGATSRDINNNATGSFGYNEQSLGVGMGVRGVLHPDLSLGVKINHLTRALGGSADRMDSVALGGEFAFGDRLSLGAVMENALSRASGDTSDRLAPLGRLGVAYNLGGGLLLAGDVAQDREVRVGTEYSWGIAAFRAGYTSEGLAFGAGLLFRQAFALDVAMVNSSALGMSDRVSLSYRFHEAQAKRGVQAAAQEYLNNAVLELKSRNYARASKSLDAALAVSPRLGAMGWSGKAQRLREFVKGMDLDALPEYQEALKAATAQGLLTHEAVIAWLDQDNERAMLFAHAAHGQDVRQEAFFKVLETLAQLTRGEIHREDFLGPAALVDHRLQRAVERVYAGKLEGAIADCKDALALDPNNPVAWTRLGSAYYAARDRVSAAQAYRNALDLDPSNAKLRRFMEQQKMGTP